MAKKVDGSKASNTGPKCSFCECGGPLVRITCARSDSDEVLDSECLCPECFHSCYDFRELFMGVVGRDIETGVVYLRGTDPYTL